MKILYICRLYSGFEDSVEKRIWSPKGAPTIARMIEYFDTSPDYDLHLIMTRKGVESGNKLGQNSVIALEGLDAPVHVLAGLSAAPSWLGRLREKMSDMRQLWYIFQSAREIKPDVIYCDRVNIVPAALFSRLTKTPVIWRVMGVLEEMHKNADHGSLRAKFIRFLWRSPFAAVICTLDGSGGSAWMKKVLRENVQRHTLLNGVDKTMKPKLGIRLPIDKIKVLFVGRLENLKGIEEFTTAFLALLKKTDRFHAVIAGDGSMKQRIVGRVIQSGFVQNFSFLGSITPQELKSVRQQSDIYVSLNRQGNLSNVNLEALSDGLVTIVPKSNATKGIDLDTDEFIPQDVFIRFGEVGDADALVKAVLRFEDQEAREDCKKKARILASTLLPSWDQRVKQEVEILENIVHRKS